VFQLATPRRPGEKRAMPRISFLAYQLGERLRIDAAVACAAAP
jgi:hypothetical protein